MRAYQENLKKYRNRCQSLQMDKESLKNDKCQLELEVTRLKEQIDTFSIASHGSALSYHKGLSHSHSILNERHLDNVSAVRVMPK